MADQGSAGFLSQHGAALIDAGYNVIPISPGKKAPGFDDWEKLRLTKTELGKLVGNGHARDGVGLLTKHTPGVDLDIRDKDLAEEMEQYVHDHIGLGPVRIGMPPKRLVLFRTETPFRKVSSRVWLDDLGVDHKVEILGDGQQFVAFAIHPDTHAPYHWLYKDSPLITEASDLPTIRESQARDLVAHFENRATQLGWTPKKKAIKAGSQLANVDRNDPFAADVGRAEIANEDLRAKLALCPGNEDYDTWLQIGMALFHQFNGAEVGRSYWHEWSEPASNYDADALDRKWDTFDITDKGRAPVTARLIIKLANEQEQQQAVESLEELRIQLVQVETLEELKKICKLVKQIEFDAASREMLSGIVKSSFKKVTGQSLGVKLARDMIRFEASDAREMPKWLKDWIYLTADETFYNSRTRQLMSKEAFNMTYSRYLLSKQDIAEGRANPEELPAAVALNRYQIQVVTDRMYLPGQDDLFTMNGAAYVNSFSEANQPPIPEKATGTDLKNVTIVQEHFVHLIADEREREIFIDYLAWVVQTSSRPDWAILLQGTENDGKTFFAAMMGAVLGADNVRILDAKNMDEEFNGWAEGSLLVCVEEVKMHGHNRFDVLNRIKPLITNDVISVRRMRRDPYNIPNTAAYILFTNFNDALPLVENDTRFFVLFSRFQTKAAIDLFKARNPKYYVNLYNTINESPGAIRKWLLERELTSDFRDRGRAPPSFAQRYMVQMNKSENMQVIEDILKESMRWDISRQLLNATELVDLMVGLDMDEIPHTKGIAKVLSSAGFMFLGKIRIEGRYCRFWSQEPDRFIRDGAVVPELVRDWAMQEL